MRKMQEIIDDVEAAQERNDPKAVTAGVIEAIKLLSKGNAQLLSDVDSLRINSLPIGAS